MHALIHMEAENLDFIEESRARLGREARAQTEAGGGCTRAGGSGSSAVQAAG